MLNWEKMRCCGRVGVVFLIRWFSHGYVLSMIYTQVYAWPECQPCVCCSWPDQRPTHSEQQHTAARASALRWGRLLCRVSCTTTSLTSLHIPSTLSRFLSLYTTPHRIFVVVLSLQSALFVVNIRVCVLFCVNCFMCYVFVYGWCLNVLFTNI